MGMKNFELNNLFVLIMQIPVCKSRKSSCGTDPE